METGEVKHAGPLGVDVADRRLLEEGVDHQLLVVAHLGEVGRKLSILPHATPDQFSAWAISAHRPRIAPEGVAERARGGRHTFFSISAFAASNRVCQSREVQGLVRPGRIEQRVDGRGCIGAESAP